MTEDHPTGEVEAHLTRLLAGVKMPRALALRAAEQVRLERAIERAGTQLLRGPEPLLVVVLAGGTGAGKSALIDALAGAEIAEVGSKRPTTTRLRVYHHRDATEGGLPVELASAALFVPHDRPELRTKVLIDTPDLDSFATQHRAITRQVLKAAGLVLYVFSPEKYLEERTWSVLREEQRFSASAAVLNKTDQVSPEELVALTEDLRRHFAALGLGDIRIFRTCALAHIPRVDGTLPTPPALDDIPALRTFLEHELHTSDVARLWQEQRQRVVAHLRVEVDRVAPEAMLAQLDEVSAAAAQRVDRLATRIMQGLAERLAAVEAELEVRATLRQHERFRGPFRTWLVVTDFLRFGLRGLVRQLAGDVPRAAGDLLERLLSGGATAAVDDLIRDEAHRLQDLLYARGLPVEPWRTLTTHMTGAPLVAEIAAEIDRRFQAAMAASKERGRAVVWVVNALGTCVPAVFVLGGLYIMSHEMLAGRYVGLPLLGHCVAMLVLVFLVLQGIGSLLLPTLSQRGPGIVRHAVQEGVARTLQSWLAMYRRDLETDLADLHEPLAALEATVASHTSV